MNDHRVNAAVIGCGNVAALYLEGMARRSRIRILGIAVTDHEKAETRGRD